MSSETQEFPSIEVNNLIEGTIAELRQLREDTERENTGSSGLSSLDSLSNEDVDLGEEEGNEDAEVEDGEELAAREVVVEHSFNQGNNLGSNSGEEEEVMALKSIAPSSQQVGKRKRKQHTEGTSYQKKGKWAGSLFGIPELWAPTFIVVELGKHVTSADTSKDHETCLALGNAIMLPPVPCVVQTATAQPSLSSSHAAPPPAAPAPDHATQQPRSLASAPCSQAKAYVVCSTTPAVLPHSSLCSPVHSQPACAAQPSPAHLSPANPQPRSPPQPLHFLYLGGKRKTRWILGKEPKPAESDPKFDEWVSDNCIILGWMFNSMEDRVYHMFMYHDTVHGLWTALTQMYAHARNESRIFELYREISHASQTSFGLSVADYFGYLQTRWEELAQYEPLSDFPSDGAVESKRLDRRHTYQFLMGLKSEFEALRTQILNTSTLPSLYEAFAIVDGDERRRRLLPSPSLPESSPIVPDQRAFAATSGNFPDPVGGGRGGGRSGGRGRGAPRTGAIAEVESIPAALPDFKQLQLQSHLGLATASQSSGPTAAIVAETPTALHDELIHPRPLPILEPPLSTPPPNGSLPPIASQDPGPRAQAPLPVSSPESGISPPLVSDILPPREAVSLARTVFLNCVGIPPNTWYFNTFRSIGEKWGSVITIDEETSQRICHLYHLQLLCKDSVELPIWRQPGSGACPSSTRAGVVSRPSSGTETTPSLPYSHNLMAVAQPELVLGDVQVGLGKCKLEG
ncbi:hypothetical protein Acr_22g0009600 [Actinidia rufa]|uniref:Uncharacterized protein n=1 Tax=Actinidia rufa TaxID=165716 RepID=A0A7J0GLC3_9ERIC|nr:hypothetical protein Acr_22g0009600 [Actinidia rufa]